MPIRILMVVGARPQFIKAAALCRAVREDSRFEMILVHTGQHYDPDMSAVFFDELEIPEPRYNLEIGGGTHGAMTGAMLAELERVCLVERPDWVVVVGDTNSTLAGALAAVKLSIPVGHVESGLRSFNRRMPEEINRVVTDHVSRLLFCPSPTAVDNLRREGIVTGVHDVGDVMYDAALFAAERARRGSGVLQRLGLRHGEYAVATVHRQENTEDPDILRGVLDYLRTQARERPVVFPLHPRTGKAIAHGNLPTDGLTLMPPVGYLDMHRLVANAACVLTDSGGLQKEAYFHRVPCVTLREETEWTELVECGWNRLWRGPDFAPRRDIDTFGSGRSAFTILDVIASSTG